MVSAAVNRPWNLTLRDPSDIAVYAHAGDIQLRKSYSSVTVSPSTISAGCFPQMVDLIDISSRARGLRHF